MESSTTHEAYELCLFGDAQGLTALLESRPNNPTLGLRFEDEEEESCYSVLGTAAQHESPACLQVLLDFKADVDSQDGGDLTTPLMEACESSRVECVRLLLERKANVHLRDKKKKTALLAACKQGSKECLQLLIDAKADVNHADNDGDTGLHYAGDKGRNECVQLLLESNADVDSKNNRDVGGIILAAFSGHLECVELMIEAKADVNQCDCEGASGIHWTCQEGKVDCLQLLIENKADINLVNDEGDTGLMLAALDGYPEILKLLMESNADVNYQATDGYTGVHCACQEGNLDCLMVLLDHYCDSPVDASIKAYALGASMEGMEEEEEALSDSDRAAAFMLMAHGADVEVAADQAVTSEKRMHVVMSLYKDIHLFTERWHSVVSDTLSDYVEVDTRVGRGDFGLYQEPLERVLEYLGLSMSANQVMNTSLDDEGVRRVLLPNCARNAHHWFQMHKQKTADKLPIQRRVSS
jgi:ankyrin repeat protein